jgi:hypothetical protein
MKIALQYLHAPWLFAPAAPQGLKTFPKNCHDRVLARVGAMCLPDEQSMVALHCRGNL